MASMNLRNTAFGVVLVGAAAASYYSGVTRRDSILSATPNAEFSNWSGTHSVVTRRLYAPENMKELENIVKLAQTGRQKLRVVGSALSPNGMALSEEGMLSLVHMDAVLAVNEQERTVTVQAGARIADVAARLRLHGLTLQNYASIREQSVGGFSQAGAHGTGAAIPPVDAQVVAMKLVTPAEGILTLSQESDPELFNLARLGLGCLGVVAEVVLRCVPAHHLLETVSVENAAGVARRHAARLASAKHLRYMWIPHTDAVVVVECVEAGEDAVPAPPAVPARQQAAPLRALALSAGVVPTAEEAEGMTAFQLRDVLLARAPLDLAWVRRVNAAEAEYWRRAAGQRLGWSDDILGFDCGGEQWVSEACLPTGTLSAPSGADLAYVADLLHLVKAAKLPAPAPIEQRWSAGSPSGLSPAAGPPTSLHSWVGIIQYLPPHGEQDGTRDAVTESFRQYRHAVSAALFEKYGAVEHWAKIEAPADPGEQQALQRRLAARYPLAAFNAARRRLDPHNLLSNAWADALIPQEAVEEEKATPSVQEHYKT